MVFGEYRDICNIDYELNRKWIHCHQLHFKNYYIFLDIYFLLFYFIFIIFHYYYFSLLIQLQSIIYLFIYLFSYLVETNDMIQRKDLWCQLCSVNSRDFYRINYITPCWQLVTAFWSDKTLRKVWIWKYCWMIDQWRSKQTVHPQHLPQHQTNVLNI